MIKAYRIISYILSSILYIMAFYGVMEPFFSEVKTDFGYTDILITIMVLLIATLTLVFTIRTRKIKIERVSKGELIDDISDLNADLPLIKNFQFLSISNLIIGLLYLLFFITVIIIQFTQGKDFMYMDFANFGDVLLPLLANILIVCYGFMQMNYALKIRKMYNSGIRVTSL